MQRNLSILYATLTCVLAAVFIIGCDSSDPANSGRTKFAVRYEAEGTFLSACDIFFITRKDGVAPDEVNQGGDVQQIAATLPWTHSFDITVTPQKPFNTSVSAVCDQDIAKTATVKIFVDSVEKASDEKTGRTVAAEAGFQLVF
jgi:hypothetical protein